VPRAAGRLGRVRGFAIKSIAGRKSVGVRGGGAGSVRSGSKMPTTGTIRYGRNAPGLERTAPIGGRIDRSTRSMRKRTAKSSANGMAGGVEGILQRWTR